MKKTLLLLLVVLLLIPLSPTAKENLSTKKEIFSMLQEAFQVQVSLSEQVRTKEEINDLLHPYFSEGYQKLFWKENVFEEEGKFVTYGSDFALFYIPFFHYSDKTKVIFSPDSIYVFEFFPAATDGPVGYEDHLEGVLLRKVDGGWKVDEFLYNNIPDSILKKANSNK
ncbi:DUF3993 domain-containing protein [Bacillus sp. EB106-08-02-XG196]|uniref:DUF3993 domain-containing protein n=1 Tax=Bacillus sp. EB106-08-02-XG196 TaxID=2737049 RepID=UPI0015C48A05|nr:DUF3993 domain-containing protein [Bacillus sp. EB106-08-02-XG196]NWQ41396.1 DUF3993 domain-containing protein [Bacillus sp. EB106-08-02-XG196]